MNNSAHASRLINDEIILTNKQANLYRNDCLVLKTKGGEILDIIQQNQYDPLITDNIVDAVNRLRLLELTFANLPNGIELDYQATAGLSDTFTDIIQLLAN